MIAGMLLGAALFAAGWALGYSLGRSHRRLRQPALVKPICGCNHTMGKHVDKTGACNFSSFDPNLDKIFQCSCLNYDGPVPLDAYYAPEIIG